MNSFAYADYSTIMGVAVIVALIIYVVTAFGFFKLFKKSGYADIAWMAWVPFFCNYAVAKFLQEETKSDEWMKWVLAFAWVADFIPGIGSLITLLLYILQVILYCSYISAFEGGTLQYVLVFLCPIALPYLWTKNYKDVATY